MQEDPLQPADKNKTIFGYAIYRAWKDNPKNVDVVEYADSQEQAKQYIKQQKKDARFEWGVGAYQ